MKYEDLATMPLVWLYANRIDKVSEALYIYRKTTGSTMMLKDAEWHYDVFRAAEIVVDEIMRRGFCEDYQLEIKALYLRGLWGIAERCITNNIRLDERELTRIRDVVIEKELLINIPPLSLFNVKSFGIEAAQVLERSIDDFLLVCHNKSIMNNEGQYYKLYRAMKDKIQNFFNYAKEKRMRIGIWGAGKKGEDFLTICDSNKENVSYVTDKDSLKWGQYLCTGHLIQDFRKIESNIDILVVMNRFYFNNIRRQVLNDEIRCFNLEAYLVLGRDGQIEAYMK